MTRKNAAAQALGRLGGAANTPAQHAARQQNAQRAGRPKRVCTTCGHAVVGGHVDRRLDETCGAHGWRWQQRNAPTGEDAPPNLLRDILDAVTEGAYVLPPALLRRLRAAARR